MGYYVDVYTEEFSFNKSKEKEVIKSIKDGIKSGLISEERWVDFDNVLNADSIYDIFEELRFELILENDTYKISYFLGEKFGGYEESLFNCIAKHMNDGYIEYVGEDHDGWRYIFNNGKLEIKYLTLS